MTDRPSQKRIRGASERLDLQRAARAEGFGSFELDLTTGGAHYSEGLRRILGVPEELALTGELFYERIHPEDREIFDLAVDRARQGGEALSFEIRVTRSDGVERVVRARGETIPSGRRDSPRVSGSIQDVTEEVASRSARDLLSYVVQSTGDAIITKAPDGTITSWNRGAEQLYGYSAEEAIGRPSGITESPDRAGEWQKLLHTVFSGQSIENFETERVRKDGRVIAVSLTVSPVTDAHGRIVQCAIIARDMTERVRYEERLRHMADHDQLTGLFNRRRFDEELKRELARAGRYAEHSAVLSIDIDNFKGINDSAGHAAGDAVLCHVAAVLDHRSRASDVVARLGGDEFAVLLSAVGEREARTVAEHVLAEIRSSPAAYGGRPFRVTGSIGVATFESDDATAGEVMVNADLAMYAAKTPGRDRVVVYTPSEARKARAMAKLT
ncbi:MAG TPA: diguanylate cyclase, partial [Solirubrobacteraceae bacterium]|nr:diguanylate cyclase [Solirubrobacteraceae bacterium]